MTVVDIDTLKKRIRTVPDHPKPGVLFYDITGVLLDYHAFGSAIVKMAGLTERPDAVVAIESRGFLFGVPLAMFWRVPFVWVRKHGKLPEPTVRRSCRLEYGQEVLCIPQDSLVPGQMVVVVDDVLATGGTADTAAMLAQDLGASVQAILVFIELTKLGGREHLEGYDVQSLLRYD